MIIVLHVRLSNTPLDTYLLFTQTVQENRATLVLPLTDQVKQPRTDLEVRLQTYVDGLCHVVLAQGFLELYVVVVVHTSSHRTLLSLSKQQRFINTL